MIAAIVPAAGAGLRMGTEVPKQFLALGGKPLLVVTLERLSASPLVETVVVAVPPGWVDKVEAELVRPFGLAKVGAVVEGGAERQDSVRAGLEALPAEVEVVVVHDGVRPFLTPGMVAAVVEAASKAGAAVTAVAVTDTLKRASRGEVMETIEREGLVSVQTPQAFRKDLLAEALGKARLDGFVATDEAALVERLGLPVGVVAGSATNIKVTTAEDLALAESIERLLNASEPGAGRAAGALK